jgi:hypothetical protein
MRQDMDRGDTFCPEEGFAKARPVRPRRFVIGIEGDDLMPSVTRRDTPYLQPF